VGGETAHGVRASDRAVQTQELSKWFDGRPALQDVSLDADFGEVIALVGENGAGKTTLLRALAGIVVPDEGSATVCGFDTVRERRSVAGHTGAMLDSQHTWYPRLSGLANLAFFAAAAGVRRTDVTPVAMAAIMTVGLEQHASERVSAYSGGMRARLAFARARITDPPVLLLDEPTAGIDRQWREELVGMLAAERSGRTVVLATHDEELLDALRPRQLELEAGRVVRARVSVVETDRS
jgi:ABC-2 type transport system ATP-binding protein